MNVAVPHSVTSTPIKHINERDFPPICLLTLSVLHFWQAPAAPLFIAKN